jgi:putative FmdB family regulatory protein
MPRYEFKCHSCDWHGLLWKSMNHCNRALCPSCGVDVSRNYSSMGMPSTQSSTIDNQYFNNGQGGFDRGLGEVVYSREHRRQIMERKGLHEVSKYDKEDFLGERKIKPPTEKEMSDQYDEAVNMVKTGEWKKGLTEKQVQEVENARSATRRGESSGTAKEEDSSAKVESKDPLRP